MKVWQITSAVQNVATVPVETIESHVGSPLTETVRKKTQNVNGLVKTDASKITLFWNQNAEGSNYREDKKNPDRYYLHTWGRLTAQASSDGGSGCLGYQEHAKQMSGFGTIQSVFEDKVTGRNAAQNQVSSNETKHEGYQAKIGTPLFIDQMDIQLAYEVIHYINPDCQ